MPGSLPSHQVSHMITELLRLHSRITVKNKITVIMALAGTVGDYQSEHGTQGHRASHLT
jgi:hypothetical protein